MIFRVPARDYNAHGATVRHLSLPRRFPMPPPEACGRGACLMGYEVGLVFAPRRSTAVVDAPGRVDRSVPHACGAVQE